MAAGIIRRHSRRCKSRAGGRCNCSPSYQAWVYSKRDAQKIRKTFEREAEAKSWRADALRGVRRGGLRVAGPKTLQEAWDEWYEGAKSGSIRNRSGDPFKPASLRSYETAMRVRVLPELGATKLAQIVRADLQRFADELLADELNPSTIQCTFLPVRAVYRRAIARGELAVDPCRGLHLPTIRGRRERFASPLEAEALLDALPEANRALWATAFYAGLRRGELMALTWNNVDLAGGVVRVERGWDDIEGPIMLKSHAGRRRVPIPQALRPHLLRQRLPREGNGLVFGDSDTEPFKPRELTKLVDGAWKAAGLNRITLHECRHTYASLMIAAGVNAKTLSTYMGHANIAITLDRYGHLMPGSEDEAAGLLDAFLVRAVTPQGPSCEQAVRSSPSGRLSFPGVRG